jgi:multidrug efflux pump subunit AcrB
LDVSPLFFQQHAGMISILSECDMGGLLVATVLTLIFLPALYIAWFRVKEPAGAASV